MAVPARVPKNSTKLSPRPGFATPEKEELLTPVWLVADGDDVVLVADIAHNEARGECGHQMRNERNTGSPPHALLPHRSGSGGSAATPVGRLRNR